MTWARRLLVVLTVALISVLAAVAALVGPYVYDDWKLDRTVRAVALDWRDFGEEKARTRLQYELDLRGIGLQIGDSNCTFAESPAGRRVTCVWGVALELPLSNLTVPLHFESDALITPSGDLR